jgi:hypothetical protein
MAKRMWLKESESLHNPMVGRETSAVITRPGRREQLSESAAENPE